MRNLTTQRRKIAGPMRNLTTQRLSQNDKYMAINRAIILMSVSIRKTLKARVIGEQLTKARELPAVVATISYV